MSILHDPALERLLARLHEKSDAQVEAIRAYQTARDKENLRRRKMPRRA